MTSEKLKTKDAASGSVNSPQPGERDYKVIAKDGVHIDGQTETIEKGKTITLSWDGARALLAEGSIEEA